MAEEKEPMRRHEVVRTGDQLLVPESMPLPEAVETLKRQMKYEEETVAISEKIDGCFWDGAYAFYRAMRKKFGWTFAKPTPGFFGPKPPQMHSVEVGVGKTELVPWGQFTVPGVDGVIGTGVDRDGEGRYCFAVNATVKRKHESVIRDLAAMTREIVASESIYRGKPVRVRFKDADGDAIQMLEPKFVDVSNADRNSLILPEHIDASVSSSIFTPVMYTAACREHRIPLKRGILLSGPYGTGKTLTAFVTANLCEQHGWTFIYCERASELSDAVQFASMYQPAAIFCEDIDRALSGARSVNMDHVLNVVDGIESKGMEIMIVLTTNHVNTINKAMLRPGRLDAVIEFEAPDALTAAKLVRTYGRELIPEREDLSAVGQSLAGCIPAVIREVVERAKLSSIKLAKGEGSLTLTAPALLDAANGMKQQLELMRTEQKALTPAEQLGTGLTEVVRLAVRQDSPAAQKSA